jgi:amidase
VTGVSFLSAQALAHLVRNGEIGCLELLDHFIGRTELLNARINAIVVRDFDRARERARSMDNAADKSGPLFGVPMTVKESFDVAGLPSTRGHLESKDHRASVSGLAIRRLEDAGVVIFGKTNVPVDLADWQSYNPVYGATSNPWNTAHTPGGSSGGSAAALAAGLTGLELGTDIGGSVRVPAHYCGVFGHKPSWGICPNFGDPATSRTAMNDIAVLGPLARSAADLRLVLDAVARPDPADTAMVPTLPSPRFGNLKDLRVAVWSNEPGQPTERETTDAIDDLADRLEREGATVSRAARPAFDPAEAYNLFLTLLNAAWSGTSSDAAVARDLAAAAKCPADDMSADAIMVRGAGMTHRTWLGLNERRHVVRRAWNAFFRDCDVLLCPPISTSALPHRQDGQTWERRIAIDGTEIAYNDQLFWPGIVGGFHLPATIAPIGRTRAGLPIGVQIAGPSHGDHATIAVADLLEQAGFGFVPPPGWT